MILRYGGMCCCWKRIRKWLGVGTRDARMSDDTSKVARVDHTHARPRLSRLQCPQLKTRDQEEDCFTAWEGFLISHRLRIFIDWNEPGGEWVEGRFGTVSCWFILWQQQLATLSDTFVFPCAINRGVVWFAINQSSHKYPTEAKTTKASW